MTTANKPENQKSNAPHDLGQITFEVWKDENDWCCTLENRKCRSSVTYVEGKNTKHRLIYLAVALYGDTFSACMALAALTDQSKDEREYGKRRVREWHAQGKTLAELAQAEIEKAKNPSLNLDQKGETL